MFETHFLEAIEQCIMYQVMTDKSFTAKTTFFGVSMLKSLKRPKAMRRIMFVDDEEDILTSVAQGLESFGFEVDTFGNPLTALSMFRLHYYDAIILDIRMPEMSGFELARRIWQIDANQSVCFFSAFEQYENEALKAFFDKNYCFVKKPIGIADLSGHIEEHLASKGMLSRWVMKI